MRITPETKQAVVTMEQQGVKIRNISRMLNISRNSVRRILRGQTTDVMYKKSSYEEITPIVQELFKRCRGNAVRIQEILQDQYEQVVPYSTLTRLVRDMELREENKKKRAGQYLFGPGKECQHDTSPHKIILDGKKLTAQCASLVLGYSRKLFIQYYPRFTRFEAKVFLTEAFRFMDGTCSRCIIDNTSVIVAHGSGPDADIAPEMEHFGLIFGVTFVPHEIDDPDRKAKVERNFSYVNGNFLAGRIFKDWHDINEQAKNWCVKTANSKPKRSLGMSPEQACLLEKPHLNPLPLHIPAVYMTLFRTVDVSGYVAVDTNRYSVPERLIGKKVEVHKSWDRELIFFKHQKVADHPRLIGKRDTRITAKGHHPPFNRYNAHSGPCEEEVILRGQDDYLNNYVGELKKRSRGRGLRPMRRLLELKRTYPEDAFKKAVEQAFHYGLYDLNRLEQMVLSFVAGDFFRIEDED